MVTLLGKVEFETPVEYLNGALPLAASYVSKGLNTNVGKRCKF